MANKADLIKRHKQLLAERASWDSHWRQIDEQLGQRDARFLTTDRNRGERANLKVLNNTPTLASRILRYGMFSGNSSPASPWYDMSTQNPSLNKTGAVKSYLYETSSRIRDVFLKSNLYNVLPDVYGSAGDYGTGAMAVLEDEQSVIRCYSFPIGSYCLATGPDGRVNTFYREFSYTVGQLVKEFGIENVSDAVKSLFNAGTTETWIDCVHAIEPNTDRDPSQATAKHKPFRSVYFEKAGSDDKLLRESGYDEFPIMAPRWDSRELDVYGHGPGMLALGDMKMLQLLEKRKLQAIDKLVNPALAVDSQLRNQRISMLPGDIVHISGLSNSGGAGIRPIYEINPHIQELNSVIAATEERINKAFYRDVLQLFIGYEGPMMTATEVNARTQDKLVALGPVLMKLNEELLDPLIERTYAIMLRRGLLPEPPPELQGEALKIDYISVIAKAQKLVDTAGLERLAGFVGNLAGAVPGVLEKVDWDNAVDSYADMVGVPPAVILSADAVKAKRDAAAKAQAQQQMMANMQNMKAGAEAFSGLANTAATNPAAAEVMAQAGSGVGGEPTALERLLGQ